MARLFFIFLVSLIVGVSSFSVNTCFRITAAFDYDNKIYLVDDDTFVVLDNEFKEDYTGKLSDVFSGLTGDLDAATVYAPDNTLYFFQGSHYYYYHVKWWSSHTEGPYEASKWGPFFKNGLDAAAYFNGSNYFFKDCQYLKDKDSGVVYESKDIGVPCNPDAAVGEGDRLYLIKGVEYWAMTKNGSVVGPHNLTDVLRLKSYNLCEKDPFVAKIEAQHEYESQNNCTVIDAAITYKESVYLFNNDKYIRLDDDGIEDKIESNSRGWGLPADIDAGVVWAVNGYTYFFKGPHYYLYYYGIFGPRSNSRWNPLFEGGIDAAGNRNGKSYFFKDCEYTIYEKANSDLVISQSQEVNVPCKPDAAFTMDDTLYIVKYDKVYAWKEDDTKAVGPTDLKDVAQVKSWKICPTPAA